MTLDAFGSNLRRIRLQRGISLVQIAESTKIAEELLAGLECNDFTEWPSGIYARAWVRQYAAAIGADADQAVDEFCRYFPQADRRAERLVRELSDLADHQLVWRDDDEQRRRVTDGQIQTPATSTGAPSLLARLRRLLFVPR